MKKISTEELYKLYLEHPKIALDSRQVEPGSIFFALKGEKFDANQFAALAVKNGAIYSVVDDPSIPDDSHFLLVENTLNSLQDLARIHRKNLEIPVIAIAGSNGKTTTKELLERILTKKYKVFATPGNLNNHIGLPCSILMIDRSHEMAILELGANHTGENEFLCSIAKPDYGITTNIGKDHLGEFGGVEGVIRAYSEFTDYFNQHPDYQYFLNADDAILNRVVSAKKCIRYGTGDVADIEGKVIESSLYLKAEIKCRLTNQEPSSFEINTAMFGSFNLSNILAAVSIGKYFAVPDEMIKAAIEEYSPDNNRSQVVVHDSNTYIFDAYNANPSSMPLAIDDFAKLDAPKKILVLGEMYELGEESEKEHSELVQYIKKYHFDEIILVGGDFQKPSRLIECQYFNDYKDLKTYLSAKPCQNTTFLIKGSRGASVEKAFFFY